MSLKKPYQYGPYNKFDDKEQWIRITEGCSNKCPFCYEPSEFRLFDIPEIIRNCVKIMDMNLLAKPEASYIINKLGTRRVNGKVVHYELVCGVDHRFLTQGIADLLKENRFVNIRLAWDWGYNQQLKIKDAVKKLMRAGYNPKDIMIFMICNWKVSFAECMKKLNLCKYWSVKVADCYFDGQVMPDVVPVYWTLDQVREFRREVRKHNQFINFSCDPEYREDSDSLQLELEGVI